MDDQSPARYSPVDHYRPLAKDIMTLHAPASELKLQNRITTLHTVKDWSPVKAQDSLHRSPVDEAPVLTFWATSCLGSLPLFCLLVLQAYLGMLRQITGRALGRSYRKTKMFGYPDGLVCSRSANGRYSIYFQVASWKACGGSASHVIVICLCSSEHLPLGIVLAPAKCLGAWLGAAWH